MKEITREDLEELSDEELEAWLLTDDLGHSRTSVLKYYVEDDE